MLKQLLVFLLSTLILFSNASFAAKVIKVKGKKIYLEMEEDVALVGDEFYLLDEANKKKGLIKITKTKESKAIADKIKGKAKVGWTLVSKTASAKAAAKPKKNLSTQKGSTNFEGEKIDSSYGRMYWGFIFGFAMDKMDSTITFGDETTETAEMSGNGISYKGIFDYGLWQQIWFRGTVGIENFNVESNDNFCGTTNNENCFAEIGYASLDLWGRFLFSNGLYRPWIGLGFSILFPMSKSAEAVSENSVTSTSIFAIGGGLDWFLNSRTFIPLQFEYAMFPPSDDVEANFMAFRVGLGFAF